MRLFKHTIFIARPREHVFDFFADFNHGPMWRQFVTSMELVEPGPVRTGSRIRASMEIGGDAYTFDMTVLAFERPSLWRHRTYENDFNGFIEYRFDAEHDGTRVTMQCDIKAIGLYGWLALPIMMLNRGKSYREQLPALKRAVEES